MSYIAPNTTVTLVKGVPISNDYQHTLYFASAANQQTYFQGLTKKNYTARSYQRYQLGMIKIDEDYNEALKYNYLFWKNTSYENKYFYAFITSVEYDNNERTNIYYEIDEIQTWLIPGLADGSITLLPSVIEREHTVYDYIGSSLTGEPVDLGPEIIHRVERPFKNPDYAQAGCEYVILVHRALNMNPVN